MMKMMMNKTIVMMVCAAMICASCGKKEETQHKEVVYSVRTMIVENKAAGFEKTYPGKVAAVQEADLAFQTAGKIVDLPIVRGQEIKKGELIAKIDSKDFENKMAAEKAKYVRAQAELDRYRSLYEDNAVSRSDLEVRERNFGVTKANLEIAEKALQDAFLYAPFDGVIARQYVENFQNVDAKEPVVSLQDLSAFKISINVPESDVGGTPRNKDGLAATVQFDVIGDQRFEISLEEWEAAADSITQTFLVKFLMPNHKDLTIRPGMTAKVALKIAPLEGSVQSLIMIPTTAIFSSAEGDPQVWIIDPETMKVTQRAITVEAMLSETVKVTGGLQSGEMIATSGVNTLRDGVKIRSISNIYKGE